MLIVRNCSAAAVSPPQSYPAGNANPRPCRCLSARGRKPKVVGVARRGADRRRGIWHQEL